MALPMAVKSCPLWRSKHMRAVTPDGLGRVEVDLVP